MILFGNHSIYPERRFNWNEFKKNNPYPLYGIFLATH